MVVGPIWFRSCVNEGQCFPHSSPTPLSCILPTHSQPHFINKHHCLSQFLRYVSPNCHTLYTSFIDRFYAIYHLLANSEVQAGRTPSYFPLHRCFIEPAEDFRWLLWTSWLVAVLCFELGNLPQSHLIIFSGNIQVWPWLPTLIAPHPIVNQSLLGLLCKLHKYYFLEHIPFSIHVRKKERKANLKQNKGSKRKYMKWISVVTLSSASVFVCCLQSHLCLFYILGMSKSDTSVDVEGVYICDSHHIWRTVLWPSGTLHTLCSKEETITSYWGHSVIFLLK